MADPGMPIRWRESLHIDRLEISELDRRVKKLEKRKKELNAKVRDLNNTIKAIQNVQ